MVKEDGRYHRISQPNLRHDSGTGKVRLVSSTIVAVMPFAPSLGGRRTTCLPKIRVNIRKKKHSEKRKHICSFGYVQRMEVSEFTDRTAVMRKKMPCHCLQRELIDQDHSESTQHTESDRMDERLRGVSPTNNFNSNQLNTLCPHMSGGHTHSTGLGQLDLLAAGNKVPEQGRLVREHVARALRVTRQVEQTLRLSVALEKEGSSREQNLVLRSARSR